MLGEKCPCGQVVVIDDVPFDRIVAEKLLKKNGFEGEVVGVESGKKALNYLEKLSLSPDRRLCILLDINMPEMNGFQFLEEYSKFPDSFKDNCAVMMVTSSLFPDDEARAMNTRCVQSFIHKPLSQEKIREAQKASRKYFFQ